MKILKSKFYLLNIKTHKAFTKPFDTETKGIEEIDKKVEFKGFILMDRKKGFEDVICIKLSKYPNNTKKLEFVNKLNDLRS